MKCISWKSKRVASLLPLLCSAFFLGHPAEGRAARLVAETLRCEYLVNPLGIDETAPRLSWTLRSDRRGERETAWQIVVASTKRNLARNIGDLWDPGRIEGDGSIGAVYSGRPLASGQLCFWKVRVWDKDGQPSAWSEPAQWSMGLLKQEDWRGEWIGFDKWRGESNESGLALPPPPYLRREFTVSKAVRRATLYATALGLVDLHLNGKLVSEDRFTPGWTDYTKRVHYRAYDVTGHLRRGRNAWGAILADGWYSGYIGWGHKRDHYGKKPRFRGQLQIDYADGTRDVIATGPEWKASSGPIREADFLMGESVDARLISNWDQPGFNDSQWSPVDTGAEMTPLIQTHPGPPVRSFALVPPQSVTQPAPGIYVFDLGRNFAGVARLKISGQPGQQITLRFAERLKPGGGIYTANLRGALATDTYVCRGGGGETWEPRFTYHGFQYVEVTGLTRPPSRDTITGVALSSATADAGRFDCSDPMLNHLARNIYWTQRANFIDIPTDCPQRDERLGWMGDAQVYIRAATLNEDAQAFFTKWLVDVQDA